ncbi:MAG: hypothetical protein Q9160_005005 [Pyrenula sp. 1 TL-2023]
MHWSLIAWLAVGLLFTQLLITLLRLLRSPLRDVPGPFLARWTRLWYLKEVAKARFEITNIDLHKKYGKIVRLAPNQYSIDDIDAARVIYGHGSQFPKSDWYSSWKHPDPKKITLFSDQNIARHSEQRRKFQTAYSMTSLVSYESFVDECGDLLTQRLAEFSGTGVPVNMAHWLQCYAFDVIGAITFSRRFGFLDAGKDVGNIMQTIENRLLYGTLAGIYANLHPILFHVVTLLGGSAAAGQNYLAQFAGDHIASRKANLKEATDDGPTDMVTKFLHAHTEDPSRFTTYDTTMIALNNIAAGGNPIWSDTTAISLSSILYQLYRNPSVLRRLRIEIDSISDSGKLSNPITFRESQEMPYLQAVIKEAMRVHPAVGLPLLRVVPSGGATICGRFFPQGTVVGINAWVAHLNEEVFGSDASSFRPERWLTDDKEQLARMDRYNLTFGLGSRNCIGRHISYLEMQKLIPRLLQQFDFELEDPHKHLTTWSFWFTKHRDFNVRVRERGTLA